MTRTKAIKPVLILASTLIPMAGASLAPNLPRIEAAFSSNPDAAFLTPLVLTAPAIVIAMTAALIGGLVDRYGRIPVLAGSLLIYAAAGSSGLYLDSLYALIAGRAAMGLAVGGLMTVITTLVADYFEGLERSDFLGTQHRLVSLWVVGLLVGGGLLSDFHWRAPFSVFLFSLVILPVALKFLPEPDIQKEDDEASDRAGGKKTPVLAIAIVYVITFIAMMMFYLVPLKLPFLVREVAGISSLKSGIAIGLSSFLTGVTARFYSLIRRRTSFRAVFALMFLLIAGSYFILANTETYAGVLLAMTMSGPGFGLFFPNINLWLSVLAPERIRGRLFGGLTTAIYLAQFTCPILAAPVIAKNGLTGVTGIYGVTAIVSGVLAAGFMARIALARIKTN